MTDHPTPLPPTAMSPPAQHTQSSTTRVIGGFTEIMSRAPQQPQRQPHHTAAHNSTQHTKDAARSTHPPTPASLIDTPDTQGLSLSGAPFEQPAYLDYASPFTQSHDQLTEYRDDLNLPSMPHVRRSSEEPASHQAKRPVRAAQSVTILSTGGTSVWDLRVSGSEPLRSIVQSHIHEIAVELQQRLQQFNRTPLPSETSQSGNHDTVFTMDAQGGDDDTLLASLEQPETPVVTAESQILPVPVAPSGNPLSRMTLAELRSFVPFMVRHELISMHVRRGEPGRHGQIRWGDAGAKPVWWPSDVLPFESPRRDPRPDSEQVLSLELVLAMHRFFLFFSMYLPADPCHFLS